MVRAAQNQTLYREVNERVASLNDAFNPILPRAEFACECADAACSERIALTTEEYEAVRARADHFAVAPADHHFLPDVERVVEQRDRFWIVEKVGAAGRIAAKMNPRARTRIGDG